ncbi:hypothetical protein ACFL1G_05810 [Planctomycetota bacterium]
MKSERHNKNMLMIVVGLFAFLIVATPLYAATEEQIEEAIEKGLAWLAEKQNPDGSWTFVTCELDEFDNWVDECGRPCGGDVDCDAVAKTALVVLKFETRAIELDLDPLGPEYEYADNVAAGLEFIVDHNNTIPIGPQPAGDPDGDGDGMGVFFRTCGFGHEIYQTGLAMTALAASGHPELYGDLLQDAVDYMAWGQVDFNCPPPSPDPEACPTGTNRGGWCYSHNTCECTDNSNSGYATLGLGFAEAAPPYGFGLTVPQFVKDELSIWIDTIQDDVDGDIDDGGSWYNPCWPFNPWVNILKTGNLLYEMALVGDTPETQRVKDAVDYIERHWNTPGGCGIGWRDHRQAMFAMMKGFEAQGIDEIEVGFIDIDWFDEVSTHLVDTQDPCGFWPCDCWGSTILSTAWAVLTLERVVPEIAQEVPVDIKPTSCPNPLNVNTRGLLPVAILGTEDFDVAEIDVATILIEGYALPLRWNYEDVATPVEDWDECECITEGPDGYMDLTLKFKEQEIIEALGEVVDREVLVITITGSLLDGSSIYGKDCVVILKNRRRNF